VPTVLQRCPRPLRLARPALALALAAGLAAGCAGTRSKPASRGLTHITATGELRVGMSGEQPPLNMTARNGELIGLEVALVRVLAQSMGVRAVLVQRPFGELLDALDAGEVDIVVSGMAITPERSERVALVGPYYTSGKALLTRSESLAAVQVPDDLNRPGLEIAALEGSTSEAFVRQSLPEVELVTAKRLEDGVRMVIDGQVDALLADQETCQFAVLRHSEAGLHASAQAFTVEPMGIAVPQDQPHLASLLQSYLTALANTGRLQKLRRYWLEDPSWVKQLR
jgi:polar amino acid transport system substrate-binding protein